MLRIIFILLLFGHVVQASSISKEKNGFQTRTEQLPPSRTAEHEFHEQIYQDKSILHSGFILHRAIDGLQRDTLNWVSDESLFSTDTNGDWWIFFEDSFYLFHETRHFDSVYGLSQTVYVSDSKGLEIREHNQRNYHAEVAVFYPNPIHSSGKKYGEVISNQNDNSYPEIEREIRFKDVAAYKAEGKVFLSTPLLKLMNLSAPNDQVDGFDEVDLVAGRSVPCFESSSVIYHLSAYMDYLRSLGYSSLLGPIAIDPRGHWGLDLSSFDPGSETPILQFGIGGVDDAEDAHVIIHEFVHALSHRASPYSYHGTERKIVEEAIADYLALGYANSISTNFTRNVFNWDAHNEYWEGYSAKFHEGYIGSKSCDKICQREKWLNVFLDLSIRTNREVVDILLLEYLSFVRPNGSHTSNAQSLLALEQQLFQGLYFHELKMQLQMNGIIENRIHEIYKQYDFKKIYCSTNIVVFSSDINEVVRADIYDLNGQLMDVYVNLRSIQIDLLKYTGDSFIIHLAFNRNGTREKVLSYLLIRL